MRTVTEPQQLDAITDLIHDQWFDVQDIVFDSVSGELTIPFGARSKGPNSDTIALQGELCVHTAIVYDVDDRAQIGYYDLNEISYTADSHTVLITSSFPLQIFAQVELLRVTVTAKAT